MLEYSRHLVNICTRHVCRSSKVLGIHRRSLSPRNNLYNMARSMLYVISEHKLHKARRRHMHLNTRSTLFRISMCMYSVPTLHKTLLSHILPHNLHNTLSPCLSLVLNKVLNKCSPIPDYTVHKVLAMCILDNKTHSTYLPPWYLLPKRRLLLIFQWNRKDNGFLHFSKKVEILHQTNSSISCLRLIRLYARKKKLHKEKYPNQKS